MTEKKPDIFDSRRRGYKIRGPAPRREILSESAAISEPSGRSKGAAKRAAPVPETPARGPPKGEVVSPKKAPAPVPKGPEPRKAATEPRKSSEAAATVPPGQPEAARGPSKASASRPAPVPRSWSKPEPRREERAAPRPDFVPVKPAPPAPSPLVSPPVVAPRVEASRRVDSPKAAPKDVVQPSMAQAPSGPIVDEHHDSPHVMARMTLVTLFSKEVGEPGTLLDHPRGRSFTLKGEIAEGAAHSNHHLMAPLTTGGSVPHTADLAFELENGAFIYIDIIDSHAKLVDLKALAFDAMQLRQRKKAPAVAVLVHVRSGGGNLHPDQVQAVAQLAYDHTFNVDEANVIFEAKFAALKQEIIGRLKAVRDGA